MGLENIADAKSLIAATFPLMALMATFHFGGARESHEHCRDELTMSQQGVRENRRF
jgi:hypothetical protein